MFGVGLPTLSELSTSFGCPCAGYSGPAPAGKAGGKRRHPSKEAESGHWGWSFTGTGSWDGFTGYSAAILWDIKIETPLGLSIYDLMNILFIGGYLFHVFEHAAISWRKQQSKFFKDSEPRPFKSPAVPKELGAIGLEAQGFLQITVLGFSMSAWYDMYDYPLVICYIAIENGHLELIYLLKKWWFSIAMLVYQRVTTKSSMFIGFSIMNHPFCGTPKWSCFGAESLWYIQKESPFLFDDIWLSVADWSSHYPLFVCFCVRRESLDPIHAYIHPSIHPSIHTYSWGEDKVVALFPAKSVRWCEHHRRRSGEVLLALVHGKIHHLCFPFWSEIGNFRYFQYLKTYSLYMLI